MPKPAARAALLLFALLLGIAGPAQAQSRVDSIALQLAPALAAADSFAAAEFAKDSVGSVTIGVIAGKELIWTRSYGYADMKARRFAGRRTVYRIGSITKPFTAVMLLQLVEAGKVKLSDPVERYFSEVRQVIGLPEGAGPITLLQLATMTSGLAREPREEGPFWTGPVSAWETTLISALPHTRYESFPGTRFSYSNIGYAILGAALARAAGQSYVDWERDRVLGPLGMGRTRFELDPALEADVARGYDVGRDGQPSDSVASREARDGRGYKVPNGAIYTTVDDLARFVAFELGQGPETVVSRVRLDSAFAGLVATAPGLSVGYGVGFMVERDPARNGGLPWIGHNGGVTGYTAAMYYNRAAQLGVIAFRNATGGSANLVRLAVDVLDRLVKTSQSSIVAEATRLVELIRDGKYAEAATHWSRDLLEKFPAAEVQEFWTATKTQAGNLRSIGAGTVNEGVSNRTVVLPLFFERGGPRATMAVTFRPDRTVADLVLRGLDPSQPRE
ncbi:MAG: serine hydrolase [Gemmatimonadota bacterium]